MGKATNADATAETKAIVITCGIKNIRVFENGDSSIRYRVTLDTVIDAMKKNYETDEYEVAQVDYIDFVPHVLIAQCISHIGGLDMMYNKKKEQAIKSGSKSGFGCAELQVVLNKAKLEIERTRFEAGDEYTDKAGETNTHENAGYNTNIIGIKISDRVQDKLDEMLDSVFEF